MAKDSARTAEALPPYFNIDPDTAMGELDNPTGTSGFASIAQACARGRADLASRGLDDQGHKVLRLFSTWEITRYLIPVAQGSIPLEIRNALAPDAAFTRIERSAGEEAVVTAVVRRQARTLRSFLGGGGGPGA